MVTRRAQSAPRIQAGLFKVVRNMIAGIFFLIFVAVVFFSGSIEYACKHSFTANNQAFFLLVGFIFVCVCLLTATLSIGRCRKIKGFFGTEHSFLLFVSIGSLALIFVQIFIVKSAWFVTDWDARALADVGNPESLVPYLSRYPNQMFLYSVFRLISLIGGVLGIESTYLSLILGGCLCVAAATWLSSIAARNLFGIMVGYITFVALFAFVGVSPWILVPYSDAYGILCPSIVLFCFSLPRETKLKWAAISFFSLVGYFIKPTSIFAFISVLLIELFLLVEKKGKGKKYILEITTKKIVPIFFGIIAAFGLSACLGHFSPEIDKSKSFSMTHFLMMGANTERMGVYSDNDVALSVSISDPKERKAVNISTWLGRIEEMKPEGIASLSLKKTLTNFADGTFAWSNEGKFWVEIRGDNLNVKDYYGIGNFSSSEENPTGKEFQANSQIIWLLILFGVCLGGCRKNVENGELVAYLSILMLAVFLMIFECRARYLFLYLPYFVMLGVAGWAAIFRKLINVAKKGQNARLYDGKGKSNLSVSYAGRA